MKWEKKENKHFIRYDLKDGDSSLIRMKIHRKKGLARKVKARIGKSKYTLEKSGTWHPEIVLRDENEKEILCLDFDRLYNGKGTIRLHEHIFSWRMHNDPMVTFDIWKDSKEKPLVRYRLTVRENKPEILHYLEANHETSPDKELLSMLGWYMFLPVAMENGIE